MTARRSIPPTKRIVFGLTLLVVIVLLVEAASFVALRLVNGSWFSPAEFAAAAGRNVVNETTAMTGTSDLVWGDYVEVIHPYFGYVGDPRRNRPAWGVSEQGFVHSKGADRLPKRAPDQLVVGVFGGSFANGVYLALERMLRDDAARLGKQAVVFNFASGGYKQPQQLNILTYLLAAGAEFDVVVNLDGLNDIALPVAENLPRNVNPFFPRAWDGRTAQSVDPETVRRIGYVEMLRARRAEWSARFLAARLNFSPTCSLVWQSVDRLMGRSLHEARGRVDESRAVGTDYVSHGPRHAFASEDEVLRGVAEFWANASRQMNAVCRDAGVVYLHFLQPNQYVEGSKPMSAAERQRAVTAGHPYAKAVRLGYPLLSKAGGALAERGVPFFDLTQIFAKSPQPLYSDDCCHTNDEGYRMVAERILAEIAAKLKEQDAAR